MHLANLFDLLLCCSLRLSRVNWNKRSLTILLCELEGFDVDWHKVFNDTVCVCVCMWLSNQSDFRVQLKMLHRQKNKYKLLQFFFQFFCFLYLKSLSVEKKLIAKRGKLILYWSTFYKFLSWKVFLIYVRLCSSSIKLGARTGRLFCVSHREGKRRNLVIKILISNVISATFHWVMKEIHWISYNILYMMEF